jgi:hypothetical protein
MEVYNDGTRPIVYARTNHGPEVIHPKKSVDLPEEFAKKIIQDFEYAQGPDKKTSPKEGMKKKAEK